MRAGWTIFAVILLMTTLASAQQMAFTRLADGFDFPVGKPDGEGYYKARGFRPGGHLGEDWNGVRGGDSDLGDPVYSIGHGLVVFARDVRLGWGNVVIVRHAFMEGSKIQHIDALYGHLDRITVREGQAVTKGQQVGTIGTNRGMYNAHLHFEIRKNLAIGINRTAFPKGFADYHDPTKFIAIRRSLRGGGRATKVAVNTFRDSRTFAPPSAGSSSSRSSTGKTKSKSFKIDRYGDIILN